MKSPEHRIEMAQRRARRQRPSCIALFDEYTGQPEAPLIGWFNLSTGVLLTENFTPSTGGTKSQPILSHDRRIRALNNRIKLAVEEVSASVEAEAPTES